MEIQEIKNDDEIKEFLAFQKRLYKGCPYYVPSLSGSEFRMIKEHPALQFCTMKMWVARRDNEIVGRIAGIVNHKCNEIKEQKRVRFAWFDLIDDVEVARALLETVAQWGKQQGLDTICGPSRFSNMEKQSMLIEGFDHTPPITSDYNYPYYPELMDAVGFEKEVDYVQYRMRVTEVPERMKHLADVLSKRYNVHLRHFKNRNELKESGKEFFYVLNESYAHIFNFIPLTEEEIDWAVDENFMIANVKLCSMLEDENGRMVGFAFCLPSLSEAFQKSGGDLFPFGWIEMVRALQKNKTVDMFLTGVLPEYQHSGIHAIYHKQLHENFLERGFEYALASQQLEDNPAIRVWEKYDSELYFRRRCYKKSIPNA